MNFSAVEMVRRRPDTFLDPSIDRFQAIALRLIGTALHDGQRRIVLSTFYKDDDYEIDRFVPLVGIPNSVRGEILLPALAAWFSIVDGSEVVAASLNAPSRETYLSTLTSPFAVVVGRNEEQGSE